MLKHLCKFLIIIDSLGLTGRDTFIMDWTYFIYEKLKYEKIPMSNFSISAFLILCSDTYGHWRKENACNVL